MKNSPKWIPAVVAGMVVASWAAAFLLGRGAGRHLRTDPAVPAPASPPEPVSRRTVSRPAPDRDADRAPVALDETSFVAVSDLKDEWEVASDPLDAPAVGAGGQEAITEMLAVIDEVKSRGLLNLRLEQAVSGLGIDDIAYAVDALAGLPAGPRRDRGLLAVVSRWAQLAPRDALGYAEDEVMPALRQQMVQAAMTGWGERNPAEALDYVASNPDWSYAEVAAQSVFGGISRMPSSDALQFLEQADAATHGVRINQALSRLVALDVNGVKAWAGTLPPGPLRDQAISQVVSVAGQYDPVETEKWMAGLSDTAVPVGQLSMLGRVWAMHDPEGAREWFLSMPPDTAGAPVGKGVFDAWFRVDSGAAADWLDGVSPEPRLDEAFVTYANHMRRRDPERAMAVTASVTDEGSRRGVQRQVLEDWMRRGDLQQALDRLLAAPLPEGDLEPLLKTVERRAQQADGGGSGRGR